MFSNLGAARDFVDLVQFCEECHGQDGVSTTPDVPIIAGFSYEGFLNTIEVFRDNERIAIEFHRPGEPETVMNEIAQSLNDDEAEQLARYFSKRQFVPALQTADAEKASRGAILHKKSCERCHTDNGREPVEDAAILAGQWTPYLKRQLDNVQQKKRLVPKSMYRKVKRLKDEDIEDLLSFYALQGMQNAN
jgi:sulfide dehydrogenase cytochrome subunit